MRIPAMQALCRKHVTIKLHMCSYAMQLPESHKFIRKSTRLLVNDDEVKALGLLFPGKDDPLHNCHDVVKCSAPGVPSVSNYAGMYPQAVLDAVPALRKAPALCLVEDASSPGCWNEVCAVGRPSKEDLLPFGASIASWTGIT